MTKCKGPCSDDWIRQNVKKIHPQEGKDTNEIVKQERGSPLLRVLAVKSFYGLFTFVALLLVAAISYSPVFANEAVAQRVKVGIVEKLGHHVPTNLVFKDAAGKDVTLKMVADGKPLIIDMAYFECRGICDVVMGQLEKILDNMFSKTAGKDFNIVTISFNSADRPADALKKKKQFWGTLDPPVPASAWRFLTGDSANIYELTNSLGFYFMRSTHGMFTHPTALIIVDGNGKIVRYVQGTTFDLADLKMALDEAKAGTPEQIISSSPKVCFSHDPAGYRITDSVLRYGGIGTMVFVAGFLVFLRSKKKSGKNQSDAS